MVCVMQAHNDTPKLSSKFKKVSKGEIFRAWPNLFECFSNSIYLFTGLKRGVTCNACLP